MKFRTGKRVINYLDDYFFAALCKLLCDLQVQSFLDLCKCINFPVSIEKTFWGTTRLTFLGMLIDTIPQIIAIPEDKILKAECLIDEILANKRTTVHKLQSLCGFLNFLGRSVVPGKAFTRHIYSAFSGKGPTKLKQHHHIRISGELKSDLFMWQKFIRHPAVFSRKFINCTPHFATELEFFYWCFEINWIWRLLWKWMDVWYLEQWFHTKFQSFNRIFGILCCHSRNSKLDPQIQQYEHHLVLWQQKCSGHDQFKLIEL